MLTVGFVYLSHFLSAQEVCFHEQTHSEPSKLVFYLMDTYGEQETEHCLLAIKSYEILHNVKVLIKEDYLEMIERLDTAISAESDENQIQLLEERKNKFVLLSTIEHTLF